MSKRRTYKALSAFLNDQSKVCLVDIVSAKGSTPREEDAWMVVSENSTFGTIGGGELENMAIDQCRKYISQKATQELELSIPLGPEIGQCCGGHVGLKINLCSKAEFSSLKMRLKQEISNYTDIYIFGAGHVGIALADCLALLPFNTLLVDTRESVFCNNQISVETKLTAVPETIVRNARPQSCFVVLTHDHALDFLITREALARRDAKYVGMIGSRTKRVSFHRWLERTGDHTAMLDDLICPIGKSELTDKRPEIIAAQVTNEILEYAFKKQQHTAETLIK